MSSRHATRPNHILRLKLFPVQWCKRCRCKVSSAHKHYPGDNYQGDHKLDPEEEWRDDISLKPSWYGEKP